MLLRYSCARGLTTTITAIDSQMFCCNVSAPMGRRRFLHSTVTHLLLFLMWDAVQDIGPLGLQSIGRKQG